MLDGTNRRTKALWQRSNAAARLRAKAGRAGAQRRKGVAAILAMMFLIMFGSLSAAMAIASKGNITTAATHLHVLRAQSAAETGMAIAQARLKDASNRFVMSDSDVNPTFGWNLWRGSTSGFGTFTVLPSKTAPQNLSPPAGLAESVGQLHQQDQNLVTAAGVSSVAIQNAPAWATGDYMGTHWVNTPAVAIETQADAEVPPLCYSVLYAPLANGTDVRVIVTGYDFSYTRGGKPITRQIMQDFRLAKRVNHAIISPTRVMVGKNVQVTGDLGVTYSDVTYNDGDPLIAKSDFAKLDDSADADSLNDKLDAFYEALADFDVDSDNRLRLQHPIESQGIDDALLAYQTGTGATDNPFEDPTGDGYVDEFDVFIDQFDDDADGAVTAAEFTNGSGQLIDKDLFNLIDSSEPDRNRNGLFGFIDSNANGRLDSGEVFVDVDPATNANRDQVLGYLDGKLDRRDRYVKMSGKLTFRATKSSWETAQGPVIERVKGAIRPNEGRTAQQYGADTNTIPELTPSVFTTARTTLQTAADGGLLAVQVATPTQVPGAGAVVANALTADANNDGLPDNYTTAYFEKMPFNSPNFVDYYYRPVYKNLVFRDVQIPAGTNAYFENCWFIGVTWIRSETNNVHPLWGEYGKLSMSGAQTTPAPSVPRTIYGDDGGETSYPTMLPSTATPPNQLILMANPPLDKADLPANQVPYVQGFNNLPDPLVIDGKRVTDTKALSNNLRFHNCLFVGSIVSDAPQGYTQARNKIQFTGTTRFVQQNPESASPTLNPDPNDSDEIATSSMMLPNYSVDVGSFNSPATQNMQLKGAIIAGVLDVRGNADIDGALLLTYKPTYGEGPLQDALGNPIGNPSAFNTTIGYFGPDDGDSESLDPDQLPLVGGQKIVGYDTNGDGLADVGPDQAQPTGSTPVAFAGFGRVTLRFDPKMRLPNGVMLPMQFDALPTTYREGKP
jgi:hypothetical protein